MVQWWFKHEQWIHRGTCTLPDALRTSRAWHAERRKQFRAELQCIKESSGLGWAGLDSNLLPPGHALYYISSLCCKGEMMLCKRRMSQAQGRGAEDINQIETLFEVNQFIILWWSQPATTKPCSDLAIASLQNIGIIWGCILKTKMGPHVLM